MELAFETEPAAAAAAVRAGGLLIDVREPYEHQQEHVPGALLIPLDELPDRLDELPADRDLYVHCHVGSRSARAVDFLRRSGRPRSSTVSGGIEAWRQAGLPVE